MFLIEYYSPGILGEYPDEHTRVVDVYSGLIIYLMIASGLMLYIKRGFIRERDKAMHSEKLMSAFLANMSHEIRTPLNSIQGFIQLLDKRVTDEKLKNYIRTIDQNSQHLLQIISDLLDISSLEAGELRLTYTNVVVKELFEDIHFMLTRHYSQFIHTWAEISYQLVPEDLTFFSDYTRLKQILLNLLTNAMKYTDKGEIKYYCQLEGRNIRFSVTDTGEGIDRDFQKEVFNRFRKKEGRKKTYSGTGIGLSITKDLVELLGGSIWFHSEINKGTEFYFTIPFLTAMPKN